MGLKKVFNMLSSIKLVHLNDVVHSIDATQYCQVIGAMKYLSLFRMDISSIIHKLSRLIDQPFVNH